MKPRKRRRSDKLLRKRKARARIERHVAELKRAKVPPGVIAQVEPLMAILIGAASKD